jgi:chorismate--pyruvate lyase
MAGGNAGFPGGVAALLIRKAQGFWHNATSFEFALMKLAIRPHCCLKHLNGSTAYRSWLNEPGSLTRRIQSHCGQFQVRHVDQRYAKAGGDKAVALVLKAKSRLLLREVYLYCNGLPVVFAHSMLPLASLKGRWHHLARLGTRPLGAALFTDPRVKRRAMGFIKLGPQHELYQRACRYLRKKPLSLWGRSSRFALDRAPILVIEVFLPPILGLRGAKKP